MTFPFLARSSTARFRHRGLYVESAAGPDLMAVDDWRHLLDEMALLNMNALGVGVYGCWPIQRDAQRDDHGYGRPVERLMVPFPEYPQLRTPQTMRYYSPAARAIQERTCLPRMFEEDFFGQVVAYGQARGIAVRPHFNGPGHSTLIPRLFPEVSARDEHGQPAGYGYCLTSACTYDLLFSLYGSLISRHLRPAGGVWWHLGLDEVDPIRGFDPSAPTRLVDPWCRCPECAAHSKAELLVRFAARTVDYLVGQGIQHVTLWHDALQTLHAFPLFRDVMAEHGLLDRIAVQWWRYQDPPLAVGQPALRSWVTPMAGYWPNLFHHDYCTNIAAMAAEGSAAGAEGMDAYSIYDPAFYRSYACVAALGQDPAQDLPGFKATFARWLFERRADAADPASPSDSGGASKTASSPPGPEVPTAFAHVETLFDSSYGPLGVLLDSLLPHPWSEVDQPPSQRAVRYPRDQVAQLAGDPLRLGQVLAVAQTQAEALRAACTGAVPRAVDARRRQLLEEYACEAAKLALVVAAFRSAAAGWTHYRRARAFATRAEAVDALTRAQASFQTARQAVVDAMAEVERVKAPYLQPAVLRDLTPLYEWCAATHDHVRDLRAEVEGGGRDDLPPL